MITFGAAMTQDCHTQHTQRNKHTQQSREPLPAKVMDSSNLNMTRPPPLILHIWADHFYARFGLWVCVNKRETSLKMSKWRCSSGFFLESNLKRVPSKNTVKKGIPPSKWRCSSWLLCLNQPDKGTLNLPENGDFPCGFPVNQRVPSKHTHTHTQLMSENGGVPLGFPLNQPEKGDIHTHPM